uniref:Uncharacterized protein n=1 Tax=Anopheles culicifacies TaxID=139723 RepID=A0A182M581_9DIPT
MTTTMSWTRRNSTSCAVDADGCPDRTVPVYRWTNGPAPGGRRSCSVPGAWNRSGRGSNLVTDETPMLMVEVCPMASRLLGMLLLLLAAPLLSSCGITFSIHPFAAGCGKLRVMLGRHGCLWGVLERDLNGSLLVHHRVSTGKPH